VSRYDQARQFLAGYQIVLDLLVAEHFGLPEARHLVEMGSHLDMSSPQKFDASLPRRKRTQVGRPGRGRWRSGPTADSSIGRSSFQKCSRFHRRNERQIKHKDKSRRLRWIRLRGGKSTLRRACGEGA